MLEFVKEVKTGNVDVENHLVKVIKESKKINKEYNYFNNISDDLALQQAKEINYKLKNKKKLGRLAGVAISVKDAICVKGVESTAGSAILKGYKPIFDATVISKLKAEDAIVIGKTTQDEFGFGSFNVNTPFGIPLNPVDKTRSTGGSSGGSCGITKKSDFPHISLGESTGGSIVCPASFCGVYGLCPTYGRISRYGLMDYASSLDKIGPIAKTIFDVALTLEVISGNDDNESTTKDIPIDKYTDYVGKDAKGIKVGVIKDAFGDGISDEVKKKVNDKISQLEDNGVKVEHVSLPITAKYGIMTYYLLAVAEASTNLALYCGMRYGASDKLDGNFNQFFSGVRSKNFGDEAKRRIILGTFTRMAGYRDAYYIKAAKVRTLIINEYRQQLKKVDALISPTMPFVAPKFKDIEKLSPLQHYMADLLTVGPNLAGLPHLNVPLESKLPIGMMIIGDHFMEKKLIQLGSV